MESRSRAPLLKVCGFGALFGGRNGQWGFSGSGLSGRVGKDGENSFTLLLIWEGL